MASVILRADHKRPRSLIEDSEEKSIAYTQWHTCVWMGLKWENLYWAS